MNMILNTDSYKYSHYLQYPPGTTHVSAYIESRGAPYEKTMFYGLQMFLKEYLNKPITMDDLNEAAAIVKVHGEPFNWNGWMRIVEKHFGYLPLMIQALPEGTMSKPGTPQVQVMNTDPELPWLTTFIETALLRAVWYPSTVATTSWHVKQIIKRYLHDTADNLDGLPFKLHDFGARGVSSNESAGIGGSAHLVNFMGTDTVMGLIYARRYYKEQMAGFSIPAAEHSTITAWGKGEESAAFANMINRFGGKGKLFAVVSDSYDIWNAVDNIWGVELARQVRTNGGTLVIRPDSGDPTRVPVLIMDQLAKRFDCTVNKKGYRMLPSYLRVIQGDGVNPTSIEQCLKNMKEQGWSADNIAFGMGGQLLQQINRDTLKYAMKCNAIKIDGGGDWIPVSKNPVDDPSKASKAGRIVNGTMQVVWENGRVIREQTFADIRALTSK